MHTPGPWRVDMTVALGAYGVWTDYATHPGHDGVGYPTQVCSVLPEMKQFRTQDAVGFATRKQRDANAILISAAPDLLAACKAMLEADLYAHAEGIWEFAKTDTVEGKAAVDAARAAIAKAEGRKP